MILLYVLATIVITGTIASVISYSEGYEAGNRYSDSLWRNYATYMGYGYWSVDENGKADFNWTKHNEIDTKIMESKCYKQQQGNNLCGIKSN